MGSFNKRLHYVLLLLLMCSAALTFFLLVFSLDTRAKVSAFAKEGMVTQGVVLDKAWSYKAGTTYHHVQVRALSVPMASNAQTGPRLIRWFTTVSVSAGR